MNVRHRGEVLVDQRCPAAAKGGAICRRHDEAADHARIHEFTRRQPLRIGIPAGNRFALKDRDDVGCFRAKLYQQRMLAWPRDQRCAGVAVGRRDVGICFCTRPRTDVAGRAGVNGRCRVRAPSAGKLLHALHA